MCTAAAWFIGPDTIAVSWIDETMLYVHVAESHAREWPGHVHEAAATQIDPDKRIIGMLGVRRGKTAAPFTKAEQSA